MSCIIPTQSADFEFFLALGVSLCFSFHVLGIGWRHQLAVSFEQHHSIWCWGWVEMYLGFSLSTTCQLLHTHLKPQMISREAKREAKRGYCRENYPTSVAVFQALLLAFVQVNLPSLDVASLLGDVVESHQRDHAMPHASDAWRCS